VSRYAVGIDLGTTHCAMARIDLEADDVVSEPLAVEQLVAAGEVAARSLLPSFVYVPPGSEGPQVLPWDAERRYAVGEHAQRRGAEVPGRVIASAKSWLCHPSVDRRRGVLPLAAPEDVERISPVEASWRYLEHLVEAYDARYAGESGSLTEQQIILTVPASFDAAARELTVEAALAAGLDDLTLLEEPQAALYAWLEQMGSGWREQVRPGDVVLVVDVGGGTSDFSAIEVRESEGELELMRVAVGDHILLGGDNMDLALAHSVRQRLEAEGTELDAWQMGALTHAARSAKERLLGDADCAAVKVVVPTRGAQLVGKAIRAEVTREQLSALLVDGFFPQVDKADAPAVRARGALTQMGLPYASDAAITKHLAAFLSKQAGALAGRGSLLHPTCVLFNGGVMRSALLRERLRGALDGWLASDGGAETRTLVGGDLDLAVARGAAVYGRVRAGHGLRIRGGTARAYYVGIESAMPAVPGMEPPISLMCVAPFGMEEGTAAELGAHQLAVVVGEPVRFRFFGSSVRRQDAAGTTLERHSPREIDELPPIEITLPAKDRPEGDMVPVRLSSQVTPVGTLLIEAVPIEPKRDDERWKVELSVREASGG
jgi:molecular chaperone DnaK (HSP70)